MRNFLRLALASALVAGALSYGRPARAEADTFGLGSGRSGALSVTVANTVVNAYESITADVAMGDTTITVGNGGSFAADDLVLVWQTTTLASAPASGDQTQISLSGLATGSFEFARVKSVSGNAVTLTNAIASSSGYKGGASQLVRVPEYTTLSVASSASITATPWDGTRGGIVVFLATGTVTLDGAIVVDADGMRGGALENDAVALGCTALDGPTGSGGSTAGGTHKGEGLVPGAYSPNGNSANATYGRGNVSSGGGGGDCHNAGGGGGGHGGEGGLGGLSASTDSSRSVGGLGGAPLSYSPLSSLSLGGGGGAGEESSSLGTGGGGGGGVIFFRANVLAGGGTLSADGQAASTSTIDGAGGGGAGGAIVVRTATSADCGAIHANGGKGGDCNSLFGPGGGGAGGVVMVQAASGTCASASAVVGGDPGLAAGLTRGATAGGAGAKPTPPNGGFSPTTCDVPVNQCGGCVLATDCPSQAPICDGNTNTCVQCLSDNDCNGGETCDTLTHACTSDGGVDGGPNDGGGTDGATDAGENDGATDGGANDGAADGGETDGGDGGVTDAGNDGGTTDAGDAGTGKDAGKDAGKLDGGDGGVPDDGELEGGGIGCDVSTAPARGVGGALGLALAALMLARRRRRDD